MNKYESLMAKAENCKKAAKITKGMMRKIWLQKAEKLEYMAKSLPLSEVI